MEAMVPTTPIEAEENTGRIHLNTFVEKSTDHHIYFLTLDFGGMSFNINYILLL